MTADRDVDALLPLPPATFHILLALVDQERHGYAIIQDVEARTGGALRLSAGTLYRSIARMVEQGLIREVTRRPPAVLDDERRRYYRITPFGTDVARRVSHHPAQKRRAASRSSAVGTGGAGQSSAPVVSMSDTIAPA